MASALEVLEVITQKSEVTFTFEAHDPGGAAIDSCGEPFPKQRLKLVNQLMRFY